MIKQTANFVARVCVCCLPVCVSCAINGQLAYRLVASKPKVYLNRRKAYYEVFGKQHRAFYNN